MRVPYDACPLCGAGDIPAFAHADCSRHPFYREPLPREMVWCRCGACGHVFTDGYFGAEAEAILFANTNPGQTVNPLDERGRDVCSRIVERVAGLRPPPGRWLDIGFGSGALLFAAQEWGYEPVGVDIRAPNVAALAALDIEAHVALDEIDGKCSVISMADVLEHEAFPARALAAVRERLTTRGVLFVSAPNAGSVQWEAMTRSRTNPYWGEIEHYHNFTRARLCALLREHGLRPVQFGISGRYRLGMEIMALRDA